MAQVAPEYLSFNLDWHLDTEEVPAWNASGLLSIDLADPRLVVEAGHGLALAVRELGIPRVRLLTNNPKKLNMLQACGLTVTERVPLKVGETAQNRAYLATKAAKSGHLL